MQNIILFIVVLLQTCFFTYSSQQPTFHITFFDDAASKKAISNIINYELWTFSAVICRGDYILLYDDHEKNIPTALLYGDSSDLSSVESFESKKLQNWQYKINHCSTLITKLHHWNKKDANFYIELWSPTKANEKKYTLFIKDCIDNRSTVASNSAPLKNQFNQKTIQALIPFVEEYLMHQKIQDKNGISPIADQGLSSPTSSTPICDERPGGQQQNIASKKQSDNSAQSFPNTKQTSIPVYKTNCQGSSLNHKSTPSMVPPIQCSGVFYEEENIIILEEANTNSLIVICSEEAVSTESNKQKLIQTIAAKNNKSIKYIITATPMGRCTSLLFEEGVQRSGFNINSKYLVKIYDSSQQGSNFCFAVNGFEVIESLKPSYIKRIQPILKGCIELAGIGLGVYICILLFNSIKSKLYL